MSNSALIDRLCDSYTDVIASLIETIFPVIKIQDVAGVRQYEEAARQSLQEPVHESREICREVIHRSYNVSSKNIRQITVLPFKIVLHTVWGAFIARLVDSHQILPLNWCQSVKLCKQVLCSFSALPPESQRSLFL